MTPEEKKKLEDAAKVARDAADAAHQAAADAQGADEALNKAADEAEELANQAQSEADAAVVEPAKGEPKEEDPEDIDFGKELEDLTTVPPQTKSELEKAEKSLHFTAERIRKLGGDPEKILKPKAPPAPVVPPEEEKNESRFVTKDDLATRDLQAEVRKLARSEDEYKVILWHTENSIRKSGNPSVDAENAYFIAHKGKIKRSFEELRRASFSAPPQGGFNGPGRKAPVDKTAPQLTSDEIATMTRRGFKKNSDGSWESKRYTMKYDSTKKGWVTERKS